MNNANAKPLQPKMILARTLASQKFLVGADTSSLLSTIGEIETARKWLVKPFCPRDRGAEVAANAARSVIG
jgi:hypothetical protein